MFIDRVRKGLLLGAAFLILTRCAIAGEPVDRSLGKADEKGNLLWYDLKNLDVEGKGWTDTKSFYDRLPSKAEAVVRPPVWSLSRNSTGLCARFVTDATAISARWTLVSDRLAMPHMAATGVSGLDLYVKTDEGRWHWLAVGQPKAVTNSAQLVGGIPAGKREYLLYLPLYNSVSSVEIGIAKEASLAKADSYGPGDRKPIVFYGTSITQGGCASRTGMVHSAILQRRLNWPVINLGFSGNGKMEPEMSKLFAELDPAVFVLDCLPNMLPAEVTERVEPFVQTLRKSRPDTPILLVEDRNYTDGFLIASKRQRNRDSQAALKKAYEKLVVADVKNLHYLAGENLLGDDGEGTVDSSHPTDLGFLRQAEVFEAALRPLLTGAPKPSK